MHIIRLVSGVLTNQNTDIIPFFYFHIKIIMFIFFYRTNKEETMKLKKIDMLEINSSNLLSLFTLKNKWCKWCKWCKWWNIKRFYTKLRIFCYSQNRTWCLGISKHLNGINNKNKLGVL